MIRFLRLVALFAFLAVTHASPGQVSWILESTEGGVRYNPARGRTLTPQEIGAPPERSLSAGDTLLVAPGASIRVFDGRERRSYAHPGGEAAPLVISVPRAVVEGDVLQRLLSGAAERRRQSAQAGVIVRPLDQSESATFSFPPRNGSYDGQSPGPFKLAFAGFLGATARIETYAVDSPTSRTGALVATHSFSVTEPEISWTPPASDLAASTFLLVRLVVNDLPQDERIVWPHEKGSAVLEERLTAELGLSTVAELRGMAVHEYFREEMNASRLQREPAD